MTHIIMNIALIIFGLLMIGFRKFMSRGSFNFYEELKLPHCSEKMYQILFAIGGIIFIIIGIVSLLSIIKSIQK